MNHPIPDHIEPGRFDNMPRKLLIQVVTQPVFEEGDLMHHLPVGMEYEALFAKAHSEDVGEATYYIEAKFNGAWRNHYLDLEFMAQHFNISHPPAKVTNPESKL